MTRAMLIKEKHLIRAGLQFRGLVHYFPGGERGDMEKICVER